MVAAALIDRLIHHAHMVTLKGKSYRLRERATGRDARGSGSGPPALRLNRDTDLNRAVHFSLPDPGALFGSC